MSTIESFPYQYNPPSKKPLDCIREAAKNYGAPDPQSRQHNIPITREALLPLITISGIQPFGMTLEEALHLLGLLYK